MRVWLARREQRGLTFRELSAEVGVPVGTLASWAWKLRRESTPGPSGHAAADERFVELVVTPSQATPAPAGSRLEVVLARERRIVVSGPFDAEQLARVVQVLERC